MHPVLIHELMSHFLTSSMIQTMLGPYLATKPSKPYKIDLTKRK